MDKVNVELTKEQLRHLINDTISYIWKIKEIVFGEDWNFGTDISEVEKLTDKQQSELKAYGYYSRKELLDYLKRIEVSNFQGLDCYTGED